MKKSIHILKLTEIEDSPYQGRMIFIEEGDKVSEE